MTDRIYLSPPEVTGADRDLLLAAIDSNWIAPIGPDLEAFEREVAARCGRDHAVGLASGTAALHLALLDLGIGPGDEVLVSTFTFVASANAVLYCGATPVFVDASASDWQISPELLTEAIQRRRRSGGRVAAAIVVDLYGQCASYRELEPELEEQGVPMISDAAESLGASHEGRAAGSFGRHAALSFNGNKIITTSGGGMLLTDDPNAAARARALASQARQPVPHYEHTELGYNYRLSNLLAAFGRGQLQDLDRRVAAKRSIRDRYVASLKDVPGLKFMPVSPSGDSNAWLTCITIDPQITTKHPEAIVATFELHDIEVRRTWKPLHLQPLYADAPRTVDGTAEHLFDTGLCLPSGSGLRPEQQDRVVEVLRSELEGTS